MGLSLAEYRHSLLEEIKADHAATGLGKTAIFTEKIVSMMQNADYLQDGFNSSFFMGTGKRNRKLRVDGYLIDDVDASLTLFVTAFLDDEVNLTKTMANAYIKMAVNFAQTAIEADMYAEIEPSRDVADLMDILINHKADIQRYKVFLLSNTIKSNTIKEIIMPNIDGKSVECQIWDIERLFDIYTSTQVREPIEIDFLDYVDDGIPCIEAQGVANESYRSYLCVIPGCLLADIYDKYGARLLEGNVRSFLSTKVSVNKKIRATILNEPSMFFAFNNGIAVTVSDMKMRNTNHGKMITRVKDIQIINGGQTTASLSNARYKDKADLDKVYVQMKLTMIGEMDVEKSEQLIRKISRSSNSQSKVSEADFFSVHPFHIEMEKISRRIFAPSVNGSQYETRWFYERARGQYLQEQMKMTSAKRKQFQKQHPKNQVLTKTDFAKYRMSWNEHPDIVSRGAQTNFMAFADVVGKQWEKDAANFNERYFRETIALAIMFKSIERLVSRQEWYDSFRANIVTYSLAIFHKAIRDSFPCMELDLLAIWNKQQMPDELRMLFTIITKQVNDFITDENNPVRNVTQWCKREFCWKNMQDKLKIILPEQILSLLVEKREISKEKQVAKRDQKFVSDTEALIKVVEIGDKWKQIARDAKKCNLIASIKEQAALKKAIKIPEEIPQEFQAKLLLTLIDRLNENGYNY